MNQYDPLARLLYGAIGPAARLLSRILPKACIQACGPIAWSQASDSHRDAPASPPRSSSPICAPCCCSVMSQAWQLKNCTASPQPASTTRAPLSPASSRRSQGRSSSPPRTTALQLAALIAGAQMLQHRPLNVFFDKARHGSSLAAFFERAGIQASAQHGGLSGVRASLRALERGECVAILPDAFEDIAQTLVVPFFNRLLRVASGTACLALRSGALIVPAFAMPRRDFGLTIHIDRPIDPCRVVAEDEAQAIFLVTRLIFARIEEQLRFAPEHWRYWDTLPRVSTPLGPCIELDDSQLMLAIESRLYRLPPGARDIPELELLLR